MCKRDSYNASYEYRRQKYSDEYTTHHYSPSESLTTFPYRCLLYTSDAADERSSVDLGGRRIIKKKKKIDSYCGLVWTANRLHEECITKQHNTHESHLFILQ